VEAFTLAINLVFESGAGLSNSNAYVSAATKTYADGSQFGADQYFVDRMATGTPNQLWFPPPPPTTTPTRTPT